MSVQQTGPLAEFVDRLSGYLPTLAAGLIVIALGLVTGWLAKRATVRILVWLRLDRLGGRFGWRAAVGKGDVRAALYQLLGNIAMVLVILVFLENALDILGLNVLSDLVSATVRYLPNLALVGVIVGIGLLVSNVVAERAQDALEEEEFEHARLIGKLLKGVLLTVVGALGLYQLGLAPQLVLAGFLIAFGAIAVAFAMAVGLGSAKAIQRGWDALFEKRKER